MAFSIKAALCAASAVCAWSAPATATTYLKVDIRASGAGWMRDTTGAQTDYNTAAFSALLPITEVSGGYSDTTANDTRTIQFRPFGYYFLIDAATTTLTDDRLTYTQKIGELTPLEYYIQFGGAFTFDFCLPSPSNLAFPTGSISPVAGCSGVTFFSQGKDTRRRFVGDATSINFSLVEGQGLATGITSAVLAVPEPTTWALMLAGFGLTGYALRRRRSRVAFA